MFRISLLFVLVVALAGCAVGLGEDYERRYNANPHVSLIPQGLSEEEVVEEAVRALQALRYQIVSAAGNEVVGYLDHRQFEATVILDIRPDQVRILSDSKYRAEDGTLDKGVPKGWMRNIKKRLDRNFEQAATRRSILNKRLNPTVKQ